MEALSDEGALRTTLARPTGLISQWRLHCSLTASAKCAVRTVLVVIMENVQRHRHALLATVGVPSSVSNVGRRVEQLKSTCQECAQVIAQTGCPTAQCTMDGSLLST